MKKFAAIGLLAITLTSCVTPAKAGTAQLNIVTIDSSNSSSFIQTIESRIKKEKLNSAIKKLKTHVGKTWYAFSGSTPAGWDCSGLVMWTYEQLGFNLKHRASVQATEGKKTNNPKPGDIVTFTYKGSKSAYHVGIYIGKGKMIHAPSPGKVTRVESVNGFAKGYSKISYRRLIATT